MKEFLFNLRYRWEQFRGYFEEMSYYQIFVLLVIIYILSKFATIPFLTSTIGDFARP